MQAIDDDNAGRLMMKRERSSSGLRMIKLPASAAATRVTKQQWC